MLGGVVKRSISSGMATKEGTTGFSLKHQKLQFNCIEKLGLKASPIGIGSFRLKDNAALSYAIQNGLNLIDSSSHFQNGNSELKIGKALEHEFKQGLKRQEIIVSTKAGFIFKDPASEVENVDFTYYHIKGENFYSLDPKFLEQEITNSLKRLLLSTIDIFYLNNPERLLQSSKKVITQAELYKQIQIAFKYLDKEVLAGRIQSYGICSNSISVKTASDHLSPSKLLELNPKNLSTIQYPLNLFEMNSISPTFDGSQTLSETLDSNSIYKITQRPLMAITSEGVRKLTINKNLSTEETINQKATDKFTLVADMEYELQMTLGSNPEDLALSSKFVIGSILSQNLSRLVDNLLAAELYFKRDIIPVLENDLLILKSKIEHTDPETKEFLNDFIRLYKPHIEDLMEKVLDISRYHQNRSNQELLNLIQISAFKDESLEVNALGVCVSANPNGTVLSGIRANEHVDNCIRACDLDSLSDDKLDYLDEMLQYQ